MRRALELGTPVPGLARNYLGCIAFARGAQNRGELSRHGPCDLICAVPRFPFRVTRGRAPWPLGPVWGSEQVSDPDIAGSYRDAFSGAPVECEGTLPLSKLFAQFPLAVLVRSDARRPSL